MGKRYGSKAAYQEARMARDKTEAEYEAERRREQAESARAPIWGLFAAAAIMSGKGTQDATKLADQTLAAYDSRFVAKAARDEDEG